MRLPLDARVPLLCDGETLQTPGKCGGHSESRAIPDLADSLPYAKQAPGRIGLT